MGNAVQTIDSKTDVSVSHETSAVLNMIERVCMSPDADMDKLEKMLDMQERILNRNAKQSFSADLAAMQAELPMVAKHGEGHNKAKYAKLEDINEAIRPTLQKHGFAVTFRIKQSDNRLLVVAILSHKAGHSEETELVLPLDTSGSKNAVQAVGSTVSYGKRYAVCALLNISTGDDTDGNIPPNDMADISGALAAIRNANSMGLLHKVFSEAWKKFGQKELRQQLTAAKDAKKKELSNA